FKDFGVAQKNLVRRLAGHGVALPAIKKSAAQDITTDKTPPRPEGQFQNAHVASGLLARKDITVFDHFADMMVQVVHAVMAQLAIQPAEAAADLQLFVHQRSRPTRLIALPQANLPVGIPVAMPYPATAVKCATRK